MNKFVVLSASIIVLATNAVAEEKQSRFSTQNPTNEHVWQGFYLGLQAGGSRTNTTHTDVWSWYGGLQDVVRFSFASGFGAKAGYDQRIGTAIAGVVAELTYGDFKAGGEIRPFLPAYNIRTQSTYLGSFRGKIGLAGSDIAFYGTAGVAFSNPGHRYNETDGSGEYYRDKGKSMGWVAGLGVDYSLAPKTSVGVELSHYDFGVVNHILLNRSGFRFGPIFKQSNSHETLMVNLTQHF